MYIYESHMGGLYATEEQQDYEGLYCEQCGDSDWEIGRADTMDEAWEMVKPGDLPCMDCPHAAEEDWEYCNNKCKEDVDTSWGHGYSLKYVMEFLAENFDAGTAEYVYLLPVDDDGKIYSKECCGKRCLLKSFCYKPEYAGKLANKLAPFFDFSWDETEDEAAELISIITAKDGTKKYIY